MNVEHEDMGRRVDTVRTFVVGIGLMCDNRSTQEKVEYLPEQETCESARLAVHS